MLFYKHTLFTNGAKMNSKNTIWEMIQQLFLWGSKHSVESPLHYGNSTALWIPEVLIWFMFRGEYIHIIEFLLGRVRARPWTSELSQVSMCGPATSTLNKKNHQRVNLFILRHVFEIVFFQTHLVFLHLEKNRQD